jgi:hypothetical protein
MLDEIMPKTPLVYSSFLLLLAFGYAYSGMDYGLTDAAGGGLALLSPAGAPIELSSQTVFIELRLDDYTVDASYELANLGEQEVRAVIGLPIVSRRLGENLPPASLAELGAWVDGAELALENSPGSVEKEPAGHGFDEPVYTEVRWRTGTVALKGGQTVRLRIRYTAGYTCSGDGPGSCWLRFLVGPERTWANNVRHARFLFKADPGLCVNEPYFAKGSVQSVRWTDADALEYALDVGEPEENDEVTIRANPREMEKYEGFCFRQGVSMGAGLRLRAQPSLQAPTLATLGRGESVLVVDKSTFTVQADGKTDHWYKALIPSGREGWVFGGYLNLEK